MQGVNQPSMFNPSALISGAASGGATETVKSRFGDLTVDLSKALVFPRGLLGIPEKFHFILANFPSEKMQQFTLLQSLEDHALSFITLPLNLDNPIVATADLKAACHDMQIAEANAAILLIVSVHRYPDQVRLSVNARAPLLIDAERRMGVQYVFQQDAYKVQHMLS
jgi:flagellar assembly factor FliW